MNIAKIVALASISLLVAILLASALNDFTRVTDNALADSAPTATPLTNAPSAIAPAKRNYLPVIFSSPASAGGVWLLTGNAGTNSATDFLGTTDNMTFTFRVSNTAAFKIIPAGGDTPNIIGGYSGNHIDGKPSAGSIIAGGGSVAFGANVISGTNINTTWSTISGGLANTISNYHVSIGGGYGNTASGHDATIAGGYFNTAGNLYATVGGGANNTAGGESSTVPGGADNVAQGAWSFAAGVHARANNDGCFVWSDANPQPLNCNTNNLFLVRAIGGVSFTTNTALTTGCSIPAGGASWNCTSNRNVKANFVDVDSRAILAQVTALPITTWNYKTQDESIRHIGPMAQDFYSEFKVGENDTTISTVDAQGVTLAAIQGLSLENQDLKAQVAAQAATVAEQAEQNANLEAQVAGLQSQNAAQQKVNASLDARLSALEEKQRTSNPLQEKGANPLPVSNDAVFIGVLVAGLIVLARRKRGR